MRDPYLYPDSEVQLLRFVVCLSKHRGFILRVIYSRTMRLICVRLWQLRMRCFIYFKEAAVIDD